MSSRSVTKAVYAQETPEGVGATVRRSIGTPALRNLSPFLMYVPSVLSVDILLLISRLDHATIKKGAGFPDHPHVLYHSLYIVQ